MSKNLAAIASAALRQLDIALGTNWRETSVHVAFGAFMGGLALLLILLFAGVPIVGF